MSLPEKSSIGGTEEHSVRGHNETREANDTSDDFFTNEPDEYIDSKNILPESKSREQLNHFFDETTSTTPAQNAAILQQESARAKGEPETFGETQVGKFLKNLFSKG